MTGRYQSFDSGQTSKDKLVFVLLLTFVERSQNCVLSLAMSSYRTTEGSFDFLTLIYSECVCVCETE